MSCKEWTEKSGGKVDYFMEHDPLFFGVHKETNELYVSGKKVLTEQKLTLSGWVNAAIIIGGFSTGFMLLIKFFESMYF